MATNSHSSPALVSEICVFDREKLFPRVVAEQVGLDHDEMAILEVTNGSSVLYNALLQYAGNYAVDLDTDLSTLKESCESSTEPNTTLDLSADKPKLVKGINGVQIAIREGPGKLSSLWDCPDDPYYAYNVSDSESDSDTDFDSDLEEFDCDDEEGDERDQKKFAAEKGSKAGTLRKKKEPPVPQYQMGLGFGKIPVSDAVVYLHHWGYGLPVPQEYGIQIFRTLTLAGESPFLLKELCALALKWRSDRDKVNLPPRPGRFNLFRFKTNGCGRGHWSDQGYKISRLPKSVILPKGQLRSIVRDMKDFVSRETKVWYEAHGLPHRRCYLFYGPPGTGKTSTISMIAGMFRLNTCFLSMTGGDFSNQVLQDALSSLPRRALLILEDVDVLFNEDRKSETASALTFSGMLNALDGLVSVDGIISVLTTNHIEKLDPALIRGGRVDRRFEFVHPNHEQMCDLFLSFYEDAPRKVAKRFADEVFSRSEPEARSIATLQQHFIYTRKQSAEACVDKVSDFFAEFYPKGGVARNPFYI